MSTLSLVSICSNADEDGTSAPLDVSAAASLIDLVLGADPKKLPALLAILWGGGCKREAHHVLASAVACRDPLSTLDEICTKALVTMVDLDKIVHTSNKSWQDLTTVVGRTDPRACALLNACDYEMGRMSAARQLPYRVIRPRLEVAAALERTTHGGRIQAVAGLRGACCPNIWQLFEHWLNS